MEIAKLVADNGVAVAVLVAVGLGIWRLALWARDSIAAVAKWASIRGDKIIDSHSAAFSAIAENQPQQTALLREVLNGQQRHEAMLADIKDNHLESK